MTNNQTKSRYLLLDNRIVERAENATLRLGKVNKHPANPLFIEDKPWEKRIDNLYGNVLFDAEANLYKCWYSPFIIADSARGMSLDERKRMPYNGRMAQEMAICYATSQDGLHWEKPNLNLVEYDDSQENNIVWRGPHGNGVFRDDRDPDPERRYKLIYKDVDSQAVSFSPDGLNWSPAQRIEGVDVAGDTHNNALWAPTLNRYVGFTRSYEQIERTLDGEATKTNHNWVRQVARIESEDFVHWSKPEVVLQHDVWEQQAYAMPVFHHAGVYLGLLVIHDQVIDRVWTELAWSADTSEWHRIESGKPFIPYSSTELDYDYGCVYGCAYPVFLDDEIRLYYGGSDWLHFGWRNACLALATLRPDGFAGLSPERAQELALIQTTVLPYQGEDVKVTADIAEDGFVQVRLVDAAGNSLAQGELRTTSTDALVIPSQAVSNNQVRLEFTLKSADLYSFVLDKP